MKKLWTILASVGLSAEGGALVGAVAGQLSATGVIRGVTVTEAAIRAHHWAGGIVGYTYGDVADCTVDGLTLTPELVGDIYDNGDKAGGIVGYLSNGDVTAAPSKTRRSSPSATSAAWSATRRWKTPPRSSPITRSKT